MVCHPSLHRPFPVFRDRAGPSLITDKTIRPPPTFDKTRPIQDVTFAVMVQVALAVHPRIIAVGASPIFNEEGPIQDVAFVVLVQITIAEMGKPKLIIATNPDMVDVPATAF